MKRTCNRKINALSPSRTTGKPKRVYRKRQWTRQAATTWALRVIKAARRLKSKRVRDRCLTAAFYAESYSRGKTLQVRLLNSAGETYGWRDEPNPFKWINEMPDALRVKPKEGR